MIRKLIIGLICSLFVLSSCDSDSTSLFDLQGEVIAIHDSVMPKMARINSLQEEFKKKIEDESITDSTHIYFKQIAKLELAHKSMMDWMHDFEPIAEDADQKKTKDYLAKQKMLIEVVKELMESSISESDEILKNNQ